MFQKIVMGCAIVLAVSVSSFAELILREQVDVAKVFAGMQCNFDIQTVKNEQYVAYYDTLRHMTIAKRSLGSTQWQYKVLPQTVGWDNHCSVNLALDDSGYVHVSGNMHVSNLVYYRSTKPYTIDEFTTPGMVGNKETSVTYPTFINGPGGQFVFQYRDGGSGHGNTLWNTYSLATKKWARLTDEGIFNGETTSSAYTAGPFLGPDNYYHIIWMWRESASANTNHDLSHMKSKDLVNWETMGGNKITLPVTQKTAGVVVDPVGTHVGLINMSFSIGWDTKGQPIITYHKYQVVGSTQISQEWNTRWEGSSWVIHQTSNWKDFKWVLDTQGSIPRTIWATPVFIDENGRLLQQYSYRDNPLSQWELDETTLKPKTDSVWQIPQTMKDYYSVESTWKGTPEVQINMKQKGDYSIRWETLPQNNDKSYPAPYPAPSMLRVYKFTKAEQVGVTGKPVGVKNVKVIQLINKNLVIRSGVKTNDKIMSVQVCSLQGKIVANKRSGSGDAVSINTATWSCGVYVVRFTEKNKSFTEKIEIH